MMVCEMDQMIRPYPTRAAIRSIACPVAVIEGDLSDPAFARAVGFVMRSLPQARLASLPGAGHLLHFDQPEGWVEVVTQRTGQAPSPAAVQSLHPQQ
jgi:pimeloyl-ACP methyl ester carboxylesterase